MDDKQREEMNAKIDALFQQIEKLGDDKMPKAMFAIEMWKSAKTCEFLGLGPMTARHEYKAAYSAFQELGLETGGLLPPCEC